MQKDKSFVVIDIETTGLNSNPDYGEVNHIIEVGAVKIEKGKITGKFSSFCACPSPLPEEIVKLTGISNEDLMDAPSVEQVLKSLYDFCGESILVGHNIRFDLGFLSYFGRKYGITFKEGYIDTLALARKYLKDAIPDYKLSTVAKYFRFKFRHHRALSDALVTAKIFLKLTDLQDKQEEKRNRWVEKHCVNCDKKCHLYEDKGKWVPEITPSVYRKTLEWLLNKDTITLVMLQREMKMSYPLANSVLDTLILDGVITCQGPRIEKKVNHKKIRGALK